MERMCPWLGLVTDGLKAWDSSSFYSLLQTMQTIPAGLCNSAHSQILIVVGSGFVHLHSFPGFESGTRGKGTCLFIVVHVVRNLMIANGEVTFNCQPEAATRGSEYTGESDGAECFGFWSVKS